MIVEPTDVGLHAGSVLPRDAREVDLLLRRVPEVAFVAEVEDCMFSAEALAAVALHPVPSQLSRLCEPDYVDRLRAALDAARERAERDQNGGLQFLSITLRHYLGGIPFGEHPLLVALLCRSRARVSGERDDPATVAAAMDDYAAMSAF